MKHHKEKAGFLVLSRRANESIMLGTKETHIQIKVVDINGGVVRLGIKAPKEMPVHREEIFVKIKNPNKQKNMSGNRR